MRLTPGSCRKSPAWLRFSGLRCVAKNRPRLINPRPANIGVTFFDWPGKDTIPCSCCAMKGWNELRKAIVTGPSIAFVRPGAVAGHGPESSQLRALQPNADEPRRSPGLVCLFCLCLCGGLTPPLKIMVRIRLKLLRQQRPERSWLRSSWDRLP